MVARWKNSAQDSHETWQDTARFMRRGEDNAFMGDSYPCGLPSKRGFLNSLGYAGDGLGESRLL
jgi:hypothetical protein